MVLGHHRPAGDAGDAEAASDFTVMDSEGSECRSASDPSDHPHALPKAVQSAPANAFLVGPIGLNGKPIWCQRDGGAFRTSSGL